MSSAPVQNLLMAGASIVRHRYETVEASIQAAPPKSWSDVDLESWLVSQAADLHSGKKFDIKADLFEQGFDRYAF